MTKAYVNFNNPPKPKYIGADISLDLRRKAALTFAENLYVKIYANHDRATDWTVSIYRTNKDGTIIVRIVADLSNGKTKERKVRVSAKQIYNFYEEN